MAYVPPPRLAYGELLALDAPRLLELARKRQREVDDLLDLAKKASSGIEGDYVDLPKLYLDASSRQQYYDDTVDALEVVLGTKPPKEATDHRGGVGDHGLDIDFDELDMMLDLMADGYDATSEHLAQAERRMRKG